MLAIVTSPVTVPFVPGEYANGNPMSGAYCGSSKFAEKCVYVQPRPNGPHVSSWASMPHSFNCFTTQSAAAKYPGELVSRGPYTSVR